LAPQFWLQQVRRTVLLADPAIEAFVGSIFKGTQSFSARVATRAQNLAMPVIGYVGGYGAGAVAAPGNDRLLAAFRKGLKETGCEEGRNVAIEYRWVAGQNDQLPTPARSDRPRRRAIYSSRNECDAGGLMSYEPDSADGHRVAGTYVGRILKGERPADLPVQQSTKVQLAINLKVAKALGITFPLTLLGRADEVIE
jgi:hypothetical protein